MGTEIDYGAVLADLEAKRAAIDAAIGGVRQVLNLGAEQTVGTQVSNERRDTSGAVRFDSFFRMSMPAAIIKFLEIAKVPQSVSEVTAALLAGGFKTTSKNLMPIVGSNLSRLKAAGDAVNVEGKWGLASWYPAARKADTTAKKNGRRRGRPKGSAKAKADKPSATPETGPGADDQIRHLHAAGKTYREIAQELGVSRAVVWRALKGGRPEGPAAERDKASGPKVTPEQIEQIRMFHAAGKKLGEIAKEVGLHHLAVWGVLKPKKAAA